MIDYPENLIPKHYWKSSIPPEEVRDKVENIAIVRRFDCSAGDCILKLLDKTKHTLSPRPSRSVIVVKL